MDKAKQYFFAIVEWCTEHKRVTIGVVCLLLGVALAKLL